MTTQRFTTDADVRDDVRQAIEAGEGADTIDADGIVREIVQTVGVDGYSDMDERTFWSIVAKHDSSQV